MKTRRSPSATCVHVAGALAAILGSSQAVHAYPLDPAKTVVNLGVHADDAAGFTLAYDSADPNIVYYAPNGGRVALSNGMPLLGYMSTPDGGYLSAELEFGVFGEEKEKLFAAIHAAGKTPVELPFRRTSVRAT